jgi:hypothetical protein
MHRLTRRPDRGYLALAALMPFGLDILLTALGQPASYWSGQRDTVLEANPIAASLLAVHPAWFLVGALLYAIAFTTAIYACPEAVAWWLSIALLLAHTGGARSWLWHFTVHYTAWEGIMNGLTAVLAAWCLLKASRRRHGSQRDMGTAGSGGVIPSSGPGGRRSG